jgi:ligand-binding sensor domain-containing protein/signal transduction histidine kinase
MVIFWGQAHGSDFDLAETAGTMRIWRNPDGLPSDLVTAILQTKDGFLWVGTGDGLVRFDGVKFTGVKLPAFSPGAAIHVTALCEDSNGRLWIGTQEAGVFALFQGRTLHYGTEQGLLDDGVTTLEADKRGLVWIGTKSGLNLWTGQDFKSFTPRDGLPDKFVSGVNVARSGTVWITTRLGMCRFTDGHIAPYAFQTESQGRSPEYLGAYEDRSGNLWAFGDTYLINLAEGKRFNYFRSSESASVRIWSLCEGRDGRLWIGTSGRGLFCFEGNRFQPVLLGENRWSYDVRAICEDKEGNLWLGTSGGGLVQLRPQSMHVLRAGEGLPNGSPTALALDAGGRIYVGMRRAGLFVGESGKFDRVGGSDGLAAQNFVTSVWAAHDGTVWTGTLGGGLYGLRNGREIHFTTANGLASDAVLTVCVDEQGSVWAGTGSGTVHRLSGQRMTRFDAQQGLPGTPVTVLLPSTTGGLWAGTQDGQILREKDGKFEVERAKDFGRHSILALHEGEQGQLWVGTAGGGLSCVANGVGMNWNVSNGLPNDIVAGIAEDAAKNLWLATGTGIYRVSRDGVNEALNNPQLPIACKLMSEVKTATGSTPLFGGTRAVLAPDGELWFAASDGVLNVNTRQSEITSSKFPVYIESAGFNGGVPVSLLRGVLWSPPAKSELPFRAPVDLQSLEIHFTALSYVTPHDLRFRHKLEGLDLDWVNDAGIRSVRYPRLPYGRYRFRVAAHNADGNWQEAADTFAFVVPTPLYFQSWAIFLYGMTAIAAVTGVVRIVSHRRLRSALAQLEQQQSLERERMRIAQDMHDDMGSKLTKISFLSEHAQVDAESTGPFAGKMQAIAQTSRELLQTMDEIVWVVNPRNDTLENLVTYLSHYAIEYFQNTRVECELRLPQEIPRYPLSSEVRHNLFLTFEETLNNVLKHSAATNVQVEMTVNPSEFEVKIVDNGRGFEARPFPDTTNRTLGRRGGNGLTNMRQRLADIAGECLVSSRPDVGTTVIVRIPLNKKTASGS